MIKGKPKIDYDIILVEPKIEGNIGAIARLCNNYQVNQLILVAPQVDHLDGEARKRAKHSIHFLTKAKVYNSLSELRENYSFLIGTSAKAGRNYNVRRQPCYPWELKEILQVSEGKLGFIFGREDRGLSNDELQLCDFLVHIPVPGKLGVLNISHAVVVVLNEIWKIIEGVEEKMTNEKSSSYEERKLFFDIFNEILETLPYEEYRKPISFHSFCTVVNRSFPSSEEIHSLIGVYKVILQQIKERKGEEIS